MEMDHPEEPISVSPEPSAVPVKSTNRDQSTTLSGKIDIPGPPPEVGIPIGGSAGIQESLAFNAGRESWMRDWKVKQQLLNAFRFFLFFFALGTTIWWAHNVLDLLRQSGSSGSGFHLADSVLIALVTTSVANFLALVLIIARSLFPHRGKDE